MYHIITHYYKLKIYNYLLLAIKWVILSEFIIYKLCGYYL